MVLTGEVSQPFKKADLGRIALRVPGVTSVTNDLKVLPLSTLTTNSGAGLRAPFTVIPCFHVTQSRLFRRSTLLWRTGG